MGLITEEVEVALNSSNMSHFENLGYIIPKVKGRWGLSTPRGTKILVKTSDLLVNSKAIVNVECDCCNKILSMIYKEYLEHNHNGKYYCTHCYGSVFRTGENNPKYNFSLTDEEREKGRNTPEYCHFVRIVLKRDNYTCQCCGKKSTSDLGVHHLDGYNWCIEKRLDETNGITLCSDCHKSFHTVYGYGSNTKKQFEEWTGKIINLPNSGIVFLPSKRVYCFETDEIYFNSKEAAKTLNINNHKYINNVCNNNSDCRSTNGYHFLWYDDYITMNHDELEEYFIRCTENKTFRKVICLETLEIFQTMANVVRKYGNLNANFSSQTGCLVTACKNIKNTAFSYHWMYYDEYLQQIENINNIVIFQNNREKAVVCITSGELFKKIKDGGKKYKISNTSISDACLGKQKYGGKLPDGTKLQWIYYSDFLKLPIEEQNEILNRNKDSSNDGSFLNCTER